MQKELSAALKGEGVRPGIFREVNGRVDERSQSRTIVETTQRDSDRRPKVSTHGKRRCSTERKKGEEGDTG